MCSAPEKAALYGMRLWSTNRFSFAEVSVGGIGVHPIETSAKVRLLGYDEFPTMLKLQLKASPATCQDLISSSSVKSASDFEQRQAVSRRIEKLGHTEYSAKLPQGTQAARTFGNWSSMQRILVGQTSQVTVDICLIYSPSRANAQIHDSSVCCDRRCYCGHWAYTVNCHDNTLQGMLLQNLPIAQHICRIRGPTSGFQPRTRCASRKVCSKDEANWERASTRWSYYNTTLRH